MTSFHKILSGVIAVCLGSCAEPDYPEAAPIVTVQTSKVTTFHTVTGGPRIQVKIDNAVNVKDTLRYEAKHGKFYSALNLTVPAGPNRLITAAQLEKDSLLVTERNAIVAGTSYSYFIVKRIQKIDNVDQEITAIRRVTDDLAPADVDYAKVRFLNFAFDAPEVMVNDVDKATTAFSARKYDEVSRGANDFTRFTSFKAGTYNFEVALTSDNTIILNIPSLKLDSKGVYTIYLRGSLTGSNDTALDYTVYKH
jgi:hypothetical protein